jgi:hypothetical protein
MARDSRCADWVDGPSGQWVHDDADAPSHWLSA